METERAVTLLNGLMGTARQLASTSSPEFTQWFAMTRSTLDTLLGPTHSIARNFRGTTWSPVVSGGDWSAAFERGRAEAVGLLGAAVFELTTLRDEAPVTDDAGTDPELWAHVAAEVQAEAWGKAAAQAVIFTEDRIRRWAGRPVGEVGKDLAVAVFGKAGNYRMGRTDGEEQGWQLFAQGIAQAVRNVDAHRLQDRPDHKRYALGVIGACSLLLTQMRHEHGNRFHDLAPVPIAVTLIDGGTA